MLQGTRTFVLQDEHGNIELTHSVSAGLDYAAVGPGARVAARARARRVSLRLATTKRSTRSRTLARLEGILPALESSHAIAYVLRAARAFGRDAVLLVNLSGRGDKDVQSVEQQSRGAPPCRGLTPRFADLRASKPHRAW